MRFVGAAVFVGVLCASLPAAAHHPPPPTGPGSIGPRSRIGLDLSTAEIALEDQPGFWRKMSLALELGFLEIASIRAEIPVAQVSYADGQDEAGPSDIELGASVLVLNAAHGHWYGTLGFAVEMPTGEVGTGLGDGHFMATPSASLMYLPHPDVTLALSVWDHFAITDAHAAEPTAATSPQTTPSHAGDPPPQPPARPEEPAQDTAVASQSATHLGSVIAPHSGHELSVRMLGVYRPNIVHFGAGGSVVAMFEGDEHLGPVTVEALVGITPLEAWSLGVSFAVPVAGQRRLAWWGGLNNEVRF